MHNGSAGLKLLSRPSNISLVMSEMQTKWKVSKVSVGISIVHAAADRTEGHRAEGGDGFSKESTHQH